VPTEPSDVCCWGKTGRIADAPSTSVSDPKRTSCHDYNVNIAGGFGAAAHDELHRGERDQAADEASAYTRGPDRRPILDMLMVSIDISGARFS
jgi:hypothetical protein